MQNGSYGVRMRGVSAATWKRYYFERSRRKRLEDAAKRKTTPTSKIVTPTSKPVTPTSKIVTPKSNEENTPTSKRITPTSSMSTPTSNEENTPTSKRITPTSKRITPTSNMYTPTSNEENLTRAIKKTLDVIDGEVSRIEIMKAVGIKDRATFTNYYLSPALKLALIEMTQPSSPRSPNQRYRLTEKGRELKCAI